MNVIAGAASMLHALNALPSAAVTAVLCTLVIAEITVIPGVLLPGGTMTLLAGALIGSGRPVLAVAVPVALAVTAGDQLAYLSGTAVIGWWRRRRRGRVPAGGPRQDRRAAIGRPGRRGETARWLTAAMPALAGAAGMPYRRFAPRLLAMRLPWLTGFLAAGVLAARSLAVVGHIAGIAGLTATAAALAVLLAVHGRLPVRAITRRPQARLGGLLLAAAAAGFACGQILQDTAAGDETVHLNPVVAALLASHVPPGAVPGAVTVSHLVQPPGLWMMAAMAVAFLDLGRRGRSTLRFAVIAAVSMTVAGVLDAVLPAPGGYPAVSPGAAAVAALAIATALFAVRWLDRAGSAAATATVGLGATGFGLALAIAGQPFTALASGASLGIAITAAVEAASRLRIGRWLADLPPGVAATG